jgi:hypothetical protein
LDTKRAVPRVPELDPVSFLFVQVTWRNDKMRTVPGYRQIDINPSEEYPFGRKGMALSRVWEKARETHTKGMLLLDGDVAIDPHDHAAMVEFVRRNNVSVCIGPAKIWPISTNFSTWVWAHRKNGAFNISEWQEYHEDPDTFSFCYTYLPERVLTACISAGMEEWTYPNVDYNVVKVTQRLNVPIKVVPNCYPKHMNF